MDLMESAEALRLRASATGLTLLSGAVMMAAGYVGGTESWLAAGFITVPGGLVILAAFALIRRADRADNRAVASSRSYRGSRIAAAVATLLSGGVMGRGTRDGGRSAVTVDLVQVRSPTVGKQGEDDDAMLSFVRS